MTLIPRRWSAPVGAALLALSIPCVAASTAGAAVQWSPAAAVPGSEGVTGYAVSVYEAGPAALALEAHGAGGVGDGAIRFATGSAAGGYGAAVPVSTGGTDATDPSVGVDASGRALAAWVEDGATVRAAIARPGAAPVAVTFPSQFQAQGVDEVAVGVSGSTAWVAVVRSTSRADGQVAAVPVNLANGGVGAALTLENEGASTLTGADNGPTSSLFAWLFSDGETAVTTRVQGAVLDSATAVANTAVGTANGTVSAAGDLQSGSQLEDPVVEPGGGRRAAVRWSREDASGTSTDFASGSNGATLGGAAALPAAASLVLSGDPAGGSAVLASRSDVSSAPIGGAATTRFSTPTRTGGIAGAGRLASADTILATSSGGATAWTAENGVANLAGGTAAIPFVRAAGGTGSATWIGAPDTAPILMEAHVTTVVVTPTPVPATPKPTAAPTPKPGSTPTPKPAATPTPAPGAPATPTLAAASPTPTPAPALASNAPQSEPVVTPAPADETGPEIKRVRISKTLIWPGAGKSKFGGPRPVVRAARATGADGAAHLRFTISEDAIIQVDLHRLKLVQGGPAGRKRCFGPDRSRGGKVTKVASWRHYRRAGSVDIAIDGKRDREPLTRGRYRIAIHATDNAGNRTSLRGPNITIC